jgi:hypothetical protein
MPRNNKPKTPKQKDPSARQNAIVRDRTISNQDAARAHNKYSERTRRPAMPTKAHLSPDKILLPEEQAFHQAKKDGLEVPFVLESHNIEPTIVKQRFTSKYMREITVPAANTMQLTVNSTLATPSNKAHLSRSSRHRWWVLAAPQGLESRVPAQPATHQQLLSWANLPPPQPLP